ncbi:MAG: hypothetical protein LBJ12_03260 [Oscillospiraceae bacterium]|jgi:hypothetical protein|nr:hypothetical protein [Oscillospiraceae bacterium]
MGGFFKIVGRIARFLIGGLGKLIIFFIPKKYRRQIVRRKRTPSKKITVVEFAARLRRKAKRRAFFSGLISFALLAYFLLTAANSSSSTVEPDDMKEMSQTESTLMLFVLAAAIGFIVSCIKAIGTAGKYKKFPRYAAALWWEPECSLETFTQRLHAQKKVRHVGEQRYFSVQPEDISTRRNRPPKPLRGIWLKMAKNTAQKKLLFFLKKRLFPGAYLNLALHHIGNIRLDEARTKNAVLLTEKPVFISVVCVDCGKLALIENETFGKCEACGAPLTERLCDTKCEHYSESLGTSCATCAHGFAAWKNTKSDLK